MPHGKPLIAVEKNTLLLRHMEDLVRRAQKTGVSHSKFLTEAEAAAVQEAYTHRTDVCLQWEGGCKNAERTVAVFLEPNWGQYEQEEIVSALALQYRKQDTLQHRDILGAALALGLERDVLGDILVQEECSYLICLASMADYLEQELNKAARVGIKTQLVPLQKLPVVEKELTESRVTVASLRLDAIIAAALNWPRTKAAACIAAGDVQVNHSECTNAAKMLEKNCLVSVRKQGRFRLLEADGFSRKGRQWIVLGFY